jgi:predicted nucleic acid-binding protein
LIEAIVSDAGPLIGFARTGLLPLLSSLYQTVLIPGRVLEELEVEADLPGSKALAEALEQGWIVPMLVEHVGSLEELRMMVDAPASFS